MCVCGGVHKYVYIDRRAHSRKYKDKLTYGYITRAHTPGGIDEFGGGGWGTATTAAKVRGKERKQQQQQKRFIEVVKEEEEETSIFINLKIGITCCCHLHPTLLLNNRGRI